MTYNFKQLSGRDFEEVVHDLLQVAWATELEIFADGRDSGIDLRRRDVDGLTIVQCKNYEGSGFASLKNKMRDELLKVRRTAPDRYVLVTSVNLTVAQKNELFNLLTPWVKAPHDIIGKKELTALLEANSEVVRRHHKLWLTSVAVMEQILLGAEKVQTNAEIDKMRRKLDVYVETSAFRRALNILKTHYVLIISGEPGIGKSTLADMIILDHLANGFQPAVITSSLSEGRRIAANGKPTIFYFDDFLGQTYLGDRPDFLGKREDADLIGFIEWVRNSGVHRFVLTTREHILTEGLARSERIRHAGLADDLYLVTLDDFNRTQQARILYNHLEFSELPLAYKEEMLRDDFFLEIIDFERFNPRVISWLSSYSRIKDVPVDTYQQYVRQLIKNPLEIWRHAFDQELSQAGRDILVALYSFSYRAYVDDLERCFDTLHAASVQRLNSRTTSGAFRSAMKELDGSFITVNDEGEVRFINPSIADYVATVLRDDPNLVLTLVTAAVQFNQVSMLIKGAEESGPLVGVMDRLKDNPAIIVAAFDRLLNGPRLRWLEKKGERFGRNVDMSPVDRSIRLLALRNVFPELASVATTSICIVVDKIGERQVQPSDAFGLLKYAWTSNLAWSDISEVVSAVRTALRHARAEDFLAILDLREVMKDDLERQFPDLRKQVEDYIAIELPDEIRACDDVESAGNLQFTLEWLLERHDVDVRHELELVKRRQADLEDEESNRYRDDTSDDVSATQTDRSPEMSDDEIRSLFRGLLG